ncbi:hypothetical protein TNCV_4114681 [Trichonephila clavipes]|nr:hypothetical protein TNCV_4114681 [Trichonephila clavipes]
MRIEQKVTVPRQGVEPMDPKPSNMTTTQMVTPDTGLLRQKKDHSPRQGMKKHKHYNKNIRGVTRKVMKPVSPLRACNGHTKRHPLVLGNDEWW